SYAQLIESTRFFEGMPEECRTRCEDKANDSNRKQDTLDECHSCIKDKSCVADIATCAGSCGQFVP
ncbi:MAG: hypothetical protein ABJB12_09430, partial [Pseudomonadota bacterium]